MKRTRIRPAFVVTLAALAPAACQKQPTHTNPPPPTATATTDDPLATPTQTETANTPPPGGKKTRTVRSPIPPQFEQYGGHMDYAKVKRLNPHGFENKTILTNNQGGCYVSVLIDPKGPIGPPGTGLRAEPVDCPDVMQDPAWDTCLHGELLKTANGDCACERMGNPPPPPSKAECPKSVD
jgi:hypothetical protein